MRRVILTITIGLYVSWAVITLPKGVNGQSGHVIDSIRLPWENNRTMSSTPNPMGETIDIVESSMVRQVPDNMTVRTTKTNQQIKTNETTRGQQLNGTDSPNNGRRILESLNKTAENPIVTGSSFDSKSTVVHHSINLSTPEPISLNITSQSTEERPTNNGSLSFKTVGTPTSNVELALHNQQKPFLKDLKNDFFSVTMPTNLSFGVPFYYKTNFSHSHASRHSADFNMTWDTQGINLHSSNESLKHGQQAQHGTWKKGEDSFRLSDKSENLHSVQTDINLRKSSGVSHLSGQAKSANLDTNEMSGHIISNRLNKFIRQNKRKQSAELNQFDVNDTVVGSSVYPHSYEFTTSGPGNSGNVHLPLQWTVKNTIIPRLNNGIFNILDSNMMPPLTQMKTASPLEASMHELSVHTGFAKSGFEPSRNRQVSNLKWRMQSNGNNISQENINQTPTTTIVKHSDLNQNPNNNNNFQSSFNWWTS